MKVVKADGYFLIALLTAIYFAMVCSAWLYFLNIIIGVPVFLISYVFWKMGKRNDLKIKRYDYVRYIWISGIPISMGSLIIYAIYN